VMLASCLGRSLVDNRQTAQDCLLILMLVAGKGEHHGS
jgi:hypothetical protein